MISQRTHFQIRNLSLISVLLSFGAFLEVQLVPSNNRTNLYFSHSLTTLMLLSQIQSLEQLSKNRSCQACKDGINLLSQCDNPTLWDRRRKPSGGDSLGVEKALGAPVHHRWMIMMDIVLESVLGSRNRRERCLDKSSCVFNQTVTFCCVEKCF